MRIMRFYCLLILLLTIVRPISAQQQVFDLVIGRGYQQNMLVCDSRAAADVMIGQFRASLRGALPIGCEWKWTNFVPRERVSGSAFSLPGQRSLPDGRLMPIAVPGEFMSAWQYDARPAAVFIFYPTEQMRLVEPDGKLAR